MDQPTEADGLKDETLCGDSASAAIIDRTDVQRLFLGLSLAVMGFAVAAIVEGRAKDVAEDVAETNPVQRLGSQRSGSTGFRVNANLAPAEELSLLPQVGPILARRIVAEREAHGPFLSVSDLERTTGIGPERISLLQPLVVTDH